MEFTTISGAIRILSEGHDFLRKENAEIRIMVNFYSIEKHLEIIIKACQLMLEKINQSPLTYRYLSGVVICQTL